jgi:hypothetical protein
MRLPTAALADKVDQRQTQTAAAVVACFQPRTVLKAAIHDFLLSRPSNSVAAIQDKPLDMGAAVGVPVRTAISLRAWVAVRILVELAAVVRLVLAP